MPDTEQVLRDGANAMQVSLDDDQVADLMRYEALVVKANQAMNLVSRKDVHRFTTRHVLDSLSIVPLLNLQTFGANGRVVDIGSGAGLPGIPLTIALRELRTTLVERSAKKARFLERTIVDLGLTQVEVQCVDAAKWHTQGVTTVVSRAMGEVTQVVQWGMRLLEPGGCMVLHNRVLPEDEAQTLDPQSQLSEIADVIEVSRHEVQVPGISQSHEVLIVRKRG